MRCLNRLYLGGILAFVLFFGRGVFLHAVEPQIPSPTGYVVDQANALSLQDKATMIRLSTQLAEKTGVEVATLVVEDTGDMGIEAYAEKVFSQWKIGNKQDQGVLFVLALKQRKLRYEVGYGAEAWFPDGKAGAALDTYVVPLLKEKQVSKAILQGHLVVIQTAAEAFDVTLSGAPSPPKRTQVQTQASGDVILFAVLLVVFLGVVTRGRIFPWLFLLLLSATRGGGNGGNGGGFGGFGGGRSGGGGSSRGW